MSATIQQTIDALRATLVGYIEATYHIGHPMVVRQRQRLLSLPGGVFQDPYLESTPRYETGDGYAQMAGIPAAAREAYLRLATPSQGKPVIFDPPYRHQARAIQAILAEQRNLMIMTGTGSGKTEAFLLPILGKLAIEARDRTASFAGHAAVRAMVLYPMNALVNDQLGRLRTLFGDPAVVAMFEGWAGRPARFARYTSRTPYAGVRSKAKDMQRLQSIGDFFVDIEQAAGRHASGRPRIAEEDARAFLLQAKLHRRGKWPAKASVADWYGDKGTAWLDRQGEFRRAVTLPDDAELLTRYEVQTSPPDLLITNYSMLEYMMMRPIERPIFDRTKAWLDACPDEKFLIVLDEAHLYRGAQGAEVGLLLRRLRERLGLSPDRFQVICATASFSDAGKAAAGDFGGQLSGVDPTTFVPVTGDLAMREPAACGGEPDVSALCGIDMEGFYASDAAAQSQSIAGFLTFRGQATGGDIGAALHAALRGYAPFNKLVNDTMAAALTFAELRASVFPQVDLDRADRAINALLALGSRARLKPGDASLLPCRIHAFFRGLPGLWACMDPDCTDLPPEDRGGPIGRLYSQPRERCACQAPVLEYFTCRHCGTSYARAYAKDVANPRHIWAEGGQPMVTADGAVEEFHPLDLLLEDPSSNEHGRAAIYDLETGRLDPADASERLRTVYLSPTAGALSAGDDTDGDGDGDDDDEDPTQGGRIAGPGQFAPCGCCGKKYRGGLSSVQDHLTKGDQPFQALLSTQLRVQPPGPNAATEFAPLRGRKVLVFSDSRQVAARLAPTLQNFSLKDVIRALLPVGYRMLGADPAIGPSVVLDHGYLAVIVAAHRFGVRIRPDLGDSEIMPTMSDVGVGETPPTAELLRLLSSRPPASLTRAIAEVIRDNQLGLEALAIASLAESSKHTAKISALPDLPGLAEDPESKLAVARVWMRTWSRAPGVWFKDMSPGWWGALVRPHRGDFAVMRRHVLNSPAAKRVFKAEWLPRLMTYLTQNATGGARLVAQELSLEIGGEWRRCSRCTSVHRPIPLLQVCIECGSPEVAAFDPATDVVFRARKQFYRAPVLEALSEREPTLLSLIAAEHTAQLNAAQPDKAFSDAENHEMRFQDIDLAWRDTDPPEPSIDVLSSTTTMEVGIDIGELSGVALRNMPPGRANYQQRSGRAGRRANAVATVVAFGSADSHDDHYFTAPDEMIRGQVVDPRLTLENPDIARRHLRAYLLQRYHEARLPHLDPEADPNLFSVLGSVHGFQSGEGLLNRVDFAGWLATERDALARAVDRWLPVELSEADRAMLIAEMATDVLREVDNAIGGEAKAPKAVPPWQDPPGGTDELGEPEDDPDVEFDKDTDFVDPTSDKLLDRLLYWGVLPRYAFPTDVAPFYVFNPLSSAFRPQMDFAPTQGLNVALSQYAPNKQIWIKGKQYTSKAIYSPYKNDRSNAWGRRRLYFDCERCGHAKTEYPYDPERRGLRLTCEACNTPNSFGPGKPWFTPPGFAHLWREAALTTPDAPNETAYATRAKLVMPSAGTDQGWLQVSDRIRALPTRQRLLVSNSGPDNDGYDYCAKCGRIESVAAPEANLHQPHPLPYPNDNEGFCEGRVSRRIVLGTDFPTDIALFSLRVDAPFRLHPAHSETGSALRTVCEALAKAACLVLDIEAGELLAEYRPALNAAGAAGAEVEVFLYDTLSGGAGFSPQLAHRGTELFRHALTILEDCPERCDTSCYRCLRSFRNRLDHRLLDRQLASQLLRHTIHGGSPAYPQNRTEMSLDLLHRDLRRQLSDTCDVERRALRADGFIAPILITRRANRATTTVDLHSPIAPSVPIHAPPPLAGDVLVTVDDLVVRRHLAEATERVKTALQ